MWTFWRHFFFEQFESINGFCSLVEVEEKRVRWRYGGEVEVESYTREVVDWYGFSGGVREVNSEGGKKGNQGWV